MLTWFAVREHDYARADSLERRSAHPDTLLYPLLQAFQAGDTRRQDELLARYDRRARSGGDISYLLFPPQSAGDVRGAERVRQLFDAFAPTQPGLALTLAFEDSWLGRYGKALAGYAAAPEMDVPRTLLLSASLGVAAQPFVQLPREQLLALYDEVAAIDSLTDTNAPGSLRLLPQFRAYALGVLSCQLGRPQEARRRALQLAQAAVPDYWRKATTALGTNLEGFAYLTSGDAARALQVFASLPEAAPADLFATPAERNLEPVWRGEALYRLGRYQEARGWFENLLYTTDLWASQSLVLLRLADIHERQGDTHGAAALYARFVERMERGDPAVQPLVRQARARLELIQRRTG